MYSVALFGFGMQFALTPHPVSLQSRSDLFGWPARRRKNQQLSHFRLDLLLVQLIIVHQLFAAFQKNIVILTLQPVLAWKCHFGTTWFNSSQLLNIFDHLMVRRYFSTAHKTYIQFVDRHWNLVGSSRHHGCLQHDIQRWFHIVHSDKGRCMIPCRYSPCTGRQSKQVRIHSWNRFVCLCRLRLHHMGYRDIRWYLKKQ